MTLKFRIEFPMHKAEKFDQHEEYFYVIETDGEKERQKRKICFHDYDDIYSEYLDIYYPERYRHRLSMEGRPLYYFAIAGRKNADIPKSFLKSMGMETA